MLPRDPKTPWLHLRGAASKERERRKDGRGGQGMRERGGEGRGKEEEGKGGENHISTFSVHFERCPSYTSLWFAYLLMKMRPTQSTARPIVNAMMSTIATDSPASAASSSSSSSSRLGGPHSSNLARNRT